MACCPSAVVPVTWMKLDSSVRGAPGDHMTGWRRGAEPPRRRGSSVAAAWAEGFMTVNVGGLRGRVAVRAVRGFPHTRLGRLLACVSSGGVLELCDDFCAADMEFYFDRSPLFFAHVLNFYRTGRLHLAQGLCVGSFRQEMEYWGLGERHLGACCSDRFSELEQQAEEREAERRRSPRRQLESAEAEPGPAQTFSWCAEARGRLWVTLENPGHSPAARAVALTSLGVVLLSILAMCVHSMPRLQEQEAELLLLELLESLCVLFFTLEFGLRLLVAPSVGGFLRSPLNAIDLVTVAPFYGTLLCQLMLGEGGGWRLEQVGQVAQTLRLMRVLRVLKLARHSPGLRSLGATLRQSGREVGLLLLFLSVGISTFSALVHVAEKDAGESPLKTVPVCWWWAAVSMTTVGYGDTFPVTPAGKAVGALCIVCGLLIVALPITNIFNKFYSLHHKARHVGAVQRLQ